MIVAPLAAPELRLHPPTKEEWENVLKAHDLYHDPFPFEEEPFDDSKLDEAL